MLSSIGKSLEDFDKITHLTTVIGNALQNFMAARTLIRDYVISADERYYTQVEQRLDVAIKAILEAESKADNHETQATVRQLHESISTWRTLAGEVRNAFSAFQYTVNDKVLTNFSILTKAGSLNLKTTSALSVAMVRDTQTANASIAGYLVNGEDRFAATAQQAITDAQQKVKQMQQGDELANSDLHSFAADLDSLGAAFREAVEKRKHAYQLFHDQLAPLGVSTQATAEQLDHQMVERQKKHGELKEAYRKLEEASLTDPLTGLSNRRFIEQHLDADVALTLRHYENWLRDATMPAPLGGDLVFFLVDMDHFKAVNDQYGHNAGDKVLIEMRQRLQEAFRESDYLVRWGGEEFLVVARDANRAEAEIMAERICESVRSREFEVDADLRLAKTCSVGFACFPFLPSHPRLLSWSQVVKLADQALYIAKYSGRNGWVGLSANDNAHPEDVIRRLAEATADAVRDGELCLTTSMANTVLTSSSAKPR
ncbi:MAG: GGDEF domain-containing protein [Pseudomonadota bacterium]